MTTLVLKELTSGRTQVVQVGRLLVAGFTGRDEDSVAEHVQELAELGVPVPDNTPTLYRLDPELAHQTTAAVVSGSNTSGEVEPVVVVTGGRRLLTIGSDHTDRDIEMQDIGASKAAAPKVIGTTAVPVEEIDDWDAVQLRSAIDGDVAYQLGTFAALLSLDALLQRLAEDEDLELRDGDVLFLGTVPAIGGIRPSPVFRAEIEVPGNGTMSLEYGVVDMASTGRPPLRKPEIEFSEVVNVPWTPVDPPVEGQTERILARDPASGLATRMLRFEPGTDTSDLGVLRHDFWEEVYILEGDLHDLTLDQTFEAGTYASRPPGMPHGPWRSVAGCVTFEVRYPAI